MAKRILLEILQDSTNARLIPTSKSTGKEVGLVSVFLAAMSSVPELARSVLRRLGQRLGVQSVLETYTEVIFDEDNDTPRPDGIICVRRSRNSKEIVWSALIEAKIHNNVIGSDQINKYAQLAVNYDIDSIITISNQLVPIPSVIPYSNLVQRRFLNKLKFYHISWFSLRTDIELLCRNMETNLSHQGRFILEEVEKYFDESNSGIRTFDSMNSEWGDLVKGIANEIRYDSNDDMITHTVGAWHQEERELCLKLSREIQIDDVVKIDIPRKHQLDAELRVEETCKSLAEDSVLHSRLIIPSAAGKLAVTANLSKRTITCKIEIDAPRGDKFKTSNRKITWLLNQLRTVEDSRVHIESIWSGRAKASQASLEEVRDDKTILISSDISNLKSFGVYLIERNSSSFVKNRKFIELLEDTVMMYYETIGQNLRQWIDPAPKKIAREVDESEDDSEEPL